MPKINVYVPDDLKRRMDAVRPPELKGSRWSRVAQSAFIQYCSEMQGPKKMKRQRPSADAVIQTLSLIIKDYRPERRRAAKTPKPK